MSPGTDFNDRPVVLLVDDQAIVIAAIRRQLEPEVDIEFHSCSAPELAIETAARLGPSVILQDLVMPNVDGLDLITAYRSHEATRQTPLIVLSSNDDARTKAEAFRRGANDYLVKLPEPVELIARIRYHSRHYRLLLQAEDASTRRKPSAASSMRQSRCGIRARNTLIFGLAKLAESRDSDTGEHLERIAAYCRVLAEQHGGRSPRRPTTGCTTISSWRLHFTTSARWAFPIRCCSSPGCSRPRSGRSSSATRSSAPRR